MKTVKSIIVTSIKDLCCWLQKENIQIVNLIPIKGVANEDIIRIEYCYKNEEV